MKPVIWHIYVGAMQPSDGKMATGSESFVKLSEYDALAAELALLSDKACTAVVAYRIALGKLTDGFKYPTEVVTIARNALAHSTEFSQREVAK